LVDVLVPNEHEIIQIAEYYHSTNAEIENAAKIIVAQGVKAVVTTLGSKGVLIIDDSLRAARIPPFPVDVVDTTAAGDAFVAALAVGLAEGKTLVEACYVANAVGALTVTKMGAQPSLPTQSELSQFLDRQEQP
jgi:ribokinase